MDNISPERGRLVPWPQSGPPVLWRTNVGTGFSSISVAEGRVYTLGNALSTDTLYCFNARDGTRLWAHSYPASLDPLLYEGGPSSTPTVHEGRVYSLGKAGDLFCLNAADGGVVWSKRLIADFGVRVAEWGFASSPLIIGERLLLNAGGQGLALHKDTGELLWLTDTNRAGYSTPVPAQIAGQEALIMFCRREVAAVSLASGARIWSVPWQTQYDQNCTDPILHGDGVLVSSWTHAGTMLTFDGTVLGTNWQNTQLSSPLSPGVKVGHYLYAFHGPSDSGNVITCVDLDTGRTKWAVNGYPVGSIIAVGGRLVILCGNGALVLAEATPERWEPLIGTYVLPGRCWTMPAFVEGVLYARNAAGDLVALELPWTPEAPEAPRLDIALQEGEVVLSWPRGPDLFRLEARRLEPEPALWEPLVADPAVVGDRRVVTNQPAVYPGLLYRLRK